MKKSLILFIITSFIISSCNNLSYEEKILQYNNLYNEAYAQSENKNYSGAINQLDKAIEITDTLSKAILLRGDCFHYLKKYDKAEDDYDDVIKIEGKTSIAYKNRAINFLVQNDSDFKGDIDNYITHHPKDKDAILLRQDYNLKNNDFEDALNDITMAMELSPDDNELQLKKAKIQSILDYKAKKRNYIIFMVLTICIVYISYFNYSNKILSPKVKLIAESQIGGSYKINSDPLIWLLPILLIVGSITLYSNIFS